MALRFHLFLPARGYGSYVTVSGMGADLLCPRSEKARQVAMTDAGQGNDDSFVDTHRVEVNFDMVEIAIWMEQAETLLARMKDRLGEFSGPTTDLERCNAQDRHPIMVKFFAKFGNRTAARRLQDLRESCKEFAWRVQPNFVPASTIADMLLYFYFWRDRRNHRRPAALTFVRPPPAAGFTTGLQHGQPETPTRRGMARQSGSETSVHRHANGGRCQLPMIIEATNALRASARQAHSRQTDDEQQHEEPPAVVQDVPPPIQPPPGLNPGYRYPHCGNLDHTWYEPHQSYVGWYLEWPQAENRHQEASAHRASRDSVSMTTAWR